MAESCCPMTMHFGTFYSTGIKNCQHPRFRAGSLAISNLIHADLLDTSIAAKDLVRHPEHHQHVKHSAVSNNIYSINICAYLPKPQRCLVPTFGTGLVQVILSQLIPTRHCETHRSYSNLWCVTTFLSKLVGLQLHDKREIAAGDILHLLPVDV